MRNDQIAAAENSQEIIQQALQQAPQRGSEAAEGPSKPLQAGLGDMVAEASGLQVPAGPAPTDAAEAPAAEPEGLSGEPAEETPQANVPPSDEEDGQKPDEPLQADLEDPAADASAPTEATEAADEDPKNGVPPSDEEDGLAAD
jgi:hypothetical protein